MKVLTSSGRQYVENIAAKYNLKTQTVEALLSAVVSGNGTMAQFNIAELGGSGQWMRGGMTMVKEMFNNSLQSTVDSLCNELSELVSTNLLYEPSAEQPHNDRMNVQRQESAFSPTARHSWPSVFGNPTSSGSQNDFQYAYFAPVRRLVIDENGKRTIYDTKHHHITGIAQQQGAGTSYTFTSEEGIIDLAGLELISEPPQQTQPIPEMVYDVNSSTDFRGQSQSGSLEVSSLEDIIMKTIEKINILFEKGQISEEEFKLKKQELLSRL